LWIADTRTTVHTPHIAGMKNIREAGQEDAIPIKSGMSEKAIKIGMSRDWTTTSLVGISVQNHFSKITRIRVEFRSLAEIFQKINVLLVLVPCPRA